MKAMRIALDTNAYVDLCRNERRVTEVVRAAEIIYLPWVVAGELRAGFLLGSRGAENHRMLLKFINSARVELLFPDDQTTHHYARIFTQLRRQGTPIPANDIWIAAIVLQHNLELCTRDEHFAALPQLTLC